MPRSRAASIGLGLAAVAMVGVDVDADLDLVEWQAPAHLVMHPVEHCHGVAAGADVGLVRDHDQDEVKILETPRCLLDSRQDAEIGHAGRRHGSSVAPHVGADHPIAVEKYGAPHHLVAFLCSLGCETRQCQTTAWNAS